jgi:preprotein translocase subunit SecA
MIADQGDLLAREIVDEKAPPEEWDWQGLSDRLQAQFGVTFALDQEQRREVAADALSKLVVEKLTRAYEDKEQNVGAETMRHLERLILLQIVDTHWKEHLLGMDHLKEGIGLRGYGQKNPLDEYKREGFNMFLGLMDTIKAQVAKTLFRVQLVQEDDVKRLEQQKQQELQQRQQQYMRMNRGEDRDDEQRQPVTRGEKIGRNEPCPCGSGKKHKRCCGQSG